MANMPCGMHDRILLPVITVISLFVLGLLLYVVVRFNRRASPVASRTTHNTMIEVVWTIVPVIILVVIAVPSITLLARQYETPPADAVTIKGDGLPMVLGLHLSRPRRDRNRVEQCSTRTRQCAAASPVSLRLITAWWCRPTRRCASRPPRPM